MGYFIPSNKLGNLKLYKYSSEDHSIISKYILKKWWSHFVKIFPMSMAPNVITLLGLMFVIVNLFAVFYYSPYLDQSQPRWCYFFYAFGLFMYQTFDGCDGCHARNTGQSGPLGELFDHSIDAINTTLGSIVFASVFKMGYGKLTLLTQFASVCNFYASTWEEYHTHTLFLSSFSGPVEGILMICVVYCITGVLGPDIWDVQLLSLDLSSLNIGVEQVTIDGKTACAVLGLASLYFNIASAMHNVNKKFLEKNKDNEEKVQTKTMEAFHGLYPFFGYYLSIILLTWVYPDYLYTHAMPLLLSIGLTIAFSVGRIILAHLTLQKFPMIQLPMFLPLAQLILTHFLVNIYNYDQDDVLLCVSWLGFGVTLGVHGMFINEIIYEITTYLDIYALSIKHKRA